MKKIWAIEQGSYSDYHIVGVFSTKENAEVIANVLKADYDEPRIVEWELDTAVSEISKGYSSFSIVMLRDGTVERINRIEISSYSLRTTLTIWRRTQAPAYIGKGIPDAINGNVLARDEKHAVKIANEKRVQFIASGEWNE